MEHTALHPTPTPSEPPEAAKKKIVLTPKKKKRLKRLITILVIALVAVLVLRSCAGGNSAVGTGVYLPSAAVRQNMVVSVTGTGTIEPVDSYRVTTLIKGEILEAPFEDGATVEKGDLLFRFDSKDMENSIARTALSVEQARLSYQDLLTNQKNSRLEANADGVVQRLYIEEGDTVSAGTVVADILDRDTMCLTVPFHAADAAGFHVGQSATVTVGGTLETLSGVVDKIYAADEVGPGGTLVRRVTVNVRNPGTLSDSASGTALVGSAACSAAAGFTYAAQKQVVAKTSGEVETLYVGEGDRVSEGTLLGTFATDSISTQIESAALSLQSAELSLESARDQLEDYSITSPIAGTVIEKNFKAGDTIDATTSGYLAVIYDMSVLTFEMSIHELDISKIQVGQTVEITSSALNNRQFTGYVDKVNINGTTAGGATTYPVTVVLREPEGLFPGMNISARIVVEHAGEVLCIPVDAVSRGQNGTSIVLVAGPGALDSAGNVIDPAKMENREVILGRNDAEFIEVLSGLEEGETVYILNQASSAMDMMMGG
ncbi:MAG: HlyD family efflux transporter periplasmic adaptor subunit [Clostridiales bacterium]|nr:HlyD family efflux transporter periplasmic adaptor subunit [Clostridiales bacterium]